MLFVDLVRGKRDAAFVGVVTQRLSDFVGRRTGLLRPSPYRATPDTTPKKHIEGLIRPSVG